jgi:hypothetical protein
MADLRAGPFAVAGALVGSPETLIVDECGLHYNDKAFMKQLRAQEVMCVQSRGENPVTVPRPRLIFIVAASATPAMSDLLTADTLVVHMTESVPTLDKEPMQVGDEVIVHDRYRFAKPLLGVITGTDGISHEGVRVELKQSNNPNWPVGAEVLVSTHQLTPAPAKTECAE